MDIKIIVIVAVVVILQIQIFKLFGRTFELAKMLERSSKLMLDNFEKELKYRKHTRENLQDIFKGIFEYLEVVADENEETGKVVLVKKGKKKNGKK